VIKARELIRRNTRNRAPIASASPCQGSAVAWHDPGAVFVVIGFSVPKPHAAVASPFFRARLRRPAPYAAPASILLDAALLRPILLED
jgi:hypothetical protein